MNSSKIENIGFKDSTLRTIFLMKRKFVLAKGAKGACAMRGFSASF